MEVAVVMWSCCLNLQGVGKPWRFFCGAVVSLVKPSRCWETLEVAAVVILNRIYLILGWKGSCLFKT
ncbi:MAG: hypothetical protein GDA51_02885 [Ekhidna sp.]|nr:hypothetical protein [Ekhidna sp.]